MSLTVAQREVKRIDRTPDRARCGLASATVGSQLGSRSAFEVIKATRPGTWRCTAWCFIMASAVLARARVGSFPAKHPTGAGAPAGPATNTLSNMLTGVH